MIDELYAVLEADVLAADLAILTSFTILYSLLVEGVCQALSPFPSIRGNTTRDFFRVGQSHCSCHAVMISIGYFFSIFGFVMHRFNTVLSKPSPRLVSRIDGYSSFSQQTLGFLTRKVHHTTST